MWKPLQRYSKQRQEWAYHCDLSLEEGEAFRIKVCGKEMKEICPKGQEFKIHLEICIEPFKKDTLDPI